MRAADPFWVPDRPTTSSLYKARVSAQGRIFCTRRMQRWLHDLPDRPQAFSEPLSPGAGPGTLSVAGPPESIRPRAQSAPAPRPSGPAAAGLGSEHSISRFRFGHPNPLSQHPVQLEQRHSQLQGVPSQLEEVDPWLADHSKLESVHPQLEHHPQLEVLPPGLQEVPLHFEDYYLQPKIPQRRSSLYFTSRPASHAQQSHHPPSQFDDLFQGLARTQVDEHKMTESEESQEPAETTDNGSAASQSKCEADMRIITRPASKRHTIHFGSNLGEMNQNLPVHNSEKDGRAQVRSRSSKSTRKRHEEDWNRCNESDHNADGVQSIALAVDEEPEKRPRSLFGSIRKRRPALGTSMEDFSSGRKSSASVMLRDMRRSSKEFFSKLAVRKKGMDLSPLESASTPVLTPF